MIEPRVKIRMKETANGADDHVNVKEYRKGRAYEVSESLANVFLTADPPLATRVGKKEPEPESEPPKVEKPEEKEEPPEPEEKKEEGPSPPETELEEGPTAKARKEAEKKK